MNYKAGEKYLITTDNWFVAPDGESYRAVFGTVMAIRSDDEVLGIKTNRGSTNWYIEIGNMLLAGCQIHYAIRADEVSLRAGVVEVKYRGKLHHERSAGPNIYCADELSDRSEK